MDGSTPSLIAMAVALVNSSGKRKAYQTQVHKIKPQLYVCGISVVLTSLIHVAVKTSRDSLRL